MTDGSLVAGLYALAAASYWSVAYPHPFVSLNRFASFTMNPTSVCSPGTVTAYGEAGFRAGNHSILAIMAPSGTGLPLPGNPSSYALTMTGLPTIALMHPVFEVPHPPAPSGWHLASTGQASCALNSANAMPFVALSVNRSGVWAASTTLITRTDAPRTVVLPTCAYLTRAPHRSVRTAHCRTFPGGSVV